MKTTQLAINICWNKNENKYDNYKDYIEICSKHNIKLVRIFCSTWGINALYNKEEINILKNILNYAQLKDITVILVLLNFTDFNRQNYLDINNIKYSWLNNKYNKKRFTSGMFFKKLDKDFLCDISFLLNEIKMFNNISFIEIMNEIDQVECNNKLISRWCNKLLIELKSKFPNYIYTCSISNYQKYQFFKDNVNCYVDLHSYSFPYNSAFKNIQHIMSLNKEILYLGEYSKHSDYPYVDDFNAKIYFVSGIWGALLFGLNYTPMTWWWDSILNNDNYKKIINFYNNNYEYISNYKLNDKNILSPKYIREQERTINNHESNKIKERIINLIKHPLFVVKEFNNIKKYITKKIMKNNDNFVYELHGNNIKSYYIEVNDKKIINIGSIVSPGQYYLIDLINVNKNIIIVNKNTNLDLFGCYLLEEDRG